jgi:glycosyltransferase involved in cell wall biosynthesis
MQRPLRVVLVGQTPPPYGGQAMMIERTLQGSYDRVELAFVRMAFSPRLAGSGRPSLRKALHLLGVVLRIALTRFRSRATTLYYPPSGPERLPVYRDMVVLLSTRWMFARTIFHFHAAGISELYLELPRWLQALFRRAFFHPAVGIRTSPLAPEDPRRLGATLDVVIPNGLEDVAGGLTPDTLAARGGSVPVILFVGVLRESKGIFVLLEACAELRARHVPFRVELVGEFHSPEVETRLARFVDERGLGDAVAHRGVLVGRDKHLAFARASVLCFPTFFEHESSGLVLIEAMQFSLPIVATSWRGVPALVEDGANGYLVPVGDSAVLADRLALVLGDRELARRLGRHGRERYEARHTLSHYHCGLQGVFDAVREAPA